MVTLPDIQNIHDKRKIDIQKVGIKGLKYPVIVGDPNKETQATVATFNMFVQLPHHRKGTHMSRFVELIQAYAGHLTIFSFREMLKDLLQRLDARAGHIEMSFLYFRAKTAPVSRCKSLLDYEVTLFGDISEPGEPVITLKIVVPVTSLCPCSKEISDFGAHNQRSLVTLAAVLSEAVEIAELIELVEREASSEVYSLLKRPDEKYVTEQAYNNPKFVEDIVRDIAIALNTRQNIVSYTIESENFESIHNHSAYACVESNMIK